MPQFPLENVDWGNVAVVLISVLVSAFLYVLNRRHTDRLFEQANYPRLHLQPDITFHPSEPNGFLKCTNVRVNITNTSSSTAASDVEGRIIIVQQHRWAFWQRSRFTFALCQKAVLPPGSAITVSLPREASPCVENFIVEEIPFLLERVLESGNLFRVPKHTGFILRFEVTYKVGAYGVSRTLHESIETRLMPVVRETEHGKDILIGWDIG